MLAIILMLVSLGLASWGAAFINYALKWNLQGFSIAYIIPIGAALIGGLAVSGLFIGNRLAKKPLKTYFMPLAVIIGMVSFFTTTYGDYYYMIEESIRVNEEVFGKFNKKQRTQFYEMMNREFGFLDYVKVLHNNSSITFTSRSNRKGAKFEGGIVSIVSFWLSVVGGGLGGWFVTTFAIGARTKDRRAGEYRDLKYLANISSDLYEKLTEEISQPTQLDQWIVEALKKFPNDKSLVGKNRVIFKILKTRSTGLGQLVLEQRQVIKNDDRVVASIQKDLTADQVNQVMVQILAIDSKERY